MHLKLLQIDRFGIFSDYKIGPFSQGFNLLVGPNEAGKSTVIHFILNLLFGFSAVKIAGRSNDYRLHEGDKLGGSLEIATGEFDENLIIQRHSSRGSGTVSLALKDGTSVDESYLERVFGHRDVYGNLYAFSLFELSNLESLNNAQLQARIYSAGMGTGAVAVPDLIAELEGFAGNLFTKRGKKQPVNEVLQRLAEIEKELAELSARTGEYDRLTERREELLKRLEHLNKQEKELSARLETERSFQRAWQSWEEYSSARFQLAELEPLPENFPLRGAERLAELNQQISRQDEEIRKIREKIENAGSEFVPNPEWERILEHEKLLTALERGIERFEAAVADSPARKTELETLEKKLAREMKDLNPSWTEKDLLAFDSSIAAKEKMSNLKKEIEKAEQAVYATEPALKEAELELPVSGQDKTHLLFASAALAAVIAGIWLVSGGNLSIGAVFLAMGIFFGAGWWMSWSRGRSQQAARERALEKKSENYRSAKEALEKARGEFRKFQAGLGLDSGLSPATVSEIFFLVDRARDTLNSLDEQKERVSGIAGYIEEYKVQVEELFSALGQSSPSPGEIAGAVKQLLDQREKAREYEKVKKQVEQRLALYAEQFAKMEAEQENLLEQKTKLISVSAESEDDPQAEDRFLQQADLAEKRHSLEETISAARSQLLVAAGPGYGLEAFLQELEKKPSEESVREAVAYAEQEREEIEERIEATNRELGEIGKELENLGSQTRSSELRLDRSVAVESLTGLAREWAAVSLALHMIRKATQRYERERQPEVLRQGQVFLTKMTGGRYKRISPIVGERRFEVLRDDSSKLPPEKLSRGTAEQLYLALRFGLVRELSRHREALPIMMDDILVNFDPARAEAACQAIVEMARTHQVIYFTCHPHIQELFVNNNPGIKVLELS